MNDKPYNVELATPTETAALFQRFKEGPARSTARRSLVLPGGLELTGEFSLTARDVNSGEVAWEHSDKNLITDYGRREWMYSRWVQMSIAFAPSIETPQLGRYSLSSDATQCVCSVLLSPVVTAATHTKTFSTTYTVPSVNRTLGTILLCSVASAALTYKGIQYVAAYALLTPPKTQTTLQTLEVVYKVSMNPIA